jgi:hypothetical protein
VVSNVPSLLTVTVVPADEKGAVWNIIDESNANECLPEEVWSGERRLVVVAGCPSTVIVTVPLAVKLLPWMGSDPPGTTGPLMVSIAWVWGCGRSLSAAINPAMMTKPTSAP